MSKHVFNRHEAKYILSKDLYSKFVCEIQNHVALDEYGETIVQSLYYDTPTNLLIRNSIEKPFYKEKIRVRSYGVATDETKVFLELKKKVDKTVFKRRISLKHCEIDSFFSSYIAPSENLKPQIFNEIVYFCKFYKNLKPSMLLIYDRTAYRQEDTDLRITFDKNVRYRTKNLSLKCEPIGKLLLENGEVLMEIKTTGGYPRWLLDLLAKYKIYKQSFSKYGTAYKQEFNLKRQEQSEVVQ